ncbi:MAG TPA: hypothetical protein VMZ52_09320 [Bryobacteraceae bacterium]|nr:hypothetical protein [Bryobacteraceae bacterium]
MPPRSVGKKLITHVLPGVIKPARVLWNEVIGFVFLALAVWAIPSTYRNIRKFDGDGESLFHAVMSCSFTLLMLFFGWSSFRKAKKISRS